MTAWFRKSASDVSEFAVASDPKKIEETLKKFVASRTRLASASDIDRSTQLFSSGLLDSLSFIELVLFIEKEFKIKLANTTNINMDSLNSIGQIVELILKGAHKVSQ